MARKDRGESALGEEVARGIAPEVKDPRVSAAGLIGVTRVECPQDLSVARAYVSIYADDAKAAKVLAGLAASASFLRGPVGRRLNLQRPPELRFVRDESAELNIRLASIIREDEDKAKAAGEGTDDEGAAPPDAIRVRRLHRRDLNRVWEFLKLVFRDVNRQTAKALTRGRAHCFGHDALVPKQPCQFITQFSRILLLV